MRERIADRRFVWILVGLGAGLGIGYFWPHEPAYAVATDRDAQFAMTTCNVSLLDPIEGIFVLDFLTGSLKGAVLNRQAGKFYSFYYRDLASDFRVDPKAEPHYSIVTGTATLPSQGQIQLGIPYSMVEAMVKEVQRRKATRGTELLKNKPQWRPSFDEISVPVMAQWKVRQMRVQDVIALAPGDVLPLDRDLISQTHVRLANSREFIGSVGIQNGRVAVQLTKHLALP